jgi:streptogramin lyase
MKRLLLTLFAALAVFAADLRAQTTTTTQPAGILHPTQNSARVNGVKIQVAPDGAIWFLESSADIIARLKDGVMRQWQIRTTDQLGANPVDFELDGDIVWFIESGQSLIPAGTCAYARLNTTTGEMSEWIIPGTIPAAFYRAPDNSVWLPQSASVLQRVQCSLTNPTPPIESCPVQNLQVTNYRSLATYAYADMIVAPDGTLWLADFGDNRIVKYVPGAATETSWTFFDPSAGRLNPSAIKFDENGSLWISERSAGRVDRFDPTTNTLFSYANIVAPIHLDIFQGRVYVTSIGATSQISVLDPNTAAIGGVSDLTPVELSVLTTTPTIPVTVRNSTIVPIDFTSTPTDIDPATFAVTNNGTLGGLLAITFPSSNTYGLTVDGGRIWTGTDGQLAELNVQAIGSATDLSVPMATSLAGPSNSKIRIDVTLSNRGSSSQTGQGYYLYSPASFAPKLPFTLGPNATSLMSDAFGNLSSFTTLLNGPVRLGTTSGTATDFSATVRSARVLPDGGTFGYLLPAHTATQSLAQGSTSTLFTGALPTEESILNLYSLDDAQATLTLFAPGGQQRGTANVLVAKNASLSFGASNPFGVAPEPGDAVRVTVTQGTLQSSVLVFDKNSTDIAPSLPSPALASSVVPWVGAFTNGASSFVSDLYLSNPSPDTSANVTVTYHGIGASGAAPTATLALAPLETQAVADVLPTLFQVPAGQGALTVSATTPVAAAVRVATHVAVGDYGTFATALDAASGLASGASAFAIGLPQTATRSGLLLLYNAGAAGTVTISGFKSNGSSAGTLQVDLDADSATVVGPVFAALGVTNQDAGRVKLEVSEGMSLFGWAAAVDVTGDIDLTPLD